MASNVETGPCLTLQGLATQVNEALDGAVGSSPTFAVELLSSPVIPYGDPPTVAIVDNSGGSPPTTYKLDFNFPNQGTGGDDGDDGETPYFVDPPTVVPVLPGDPATVSMTGPTGSPPAYQLTFGIPSGLKGDEGTSPDPPTFSIDTVVDLPYGTDPTVSVVSDPPSNWELSFGIPRGATGAGGGDSSLQPSIIVRLKATPGSGGSGTLISAYHSDDNNLLPGTPGVTVLGVINTREYASHGQAGQYWKADWSVADGAYELIHEILPLGILKGIPKNTFHPTSGTAAVDNLEVVNGRLPTDSSSVALSEVTIHNDVVQTHGEINEELYLFHDRSVGSDESDQWVPFPRTPFSLIRGTASDPVTMATNTFILTGVTSVRGPVPGSTIEISNNPKCVFAGGSLVYAAYNAADIKKWDTADSHNFEAILRGIGSWDVAKDQSIGHDENSIDVEWQEDMEC